MTDKIDEQEATEGEMEVLELMIAACAEKLHQDIGCPVDIAVLRIKELVAKGAITFERYNVVDPKGNPTGVFAYKLNADNEKIDACAAESDHWGRTVQ